LDLVGLQSAAFTVPRANSLGNLENDDAVIRLICVGMPGAVCPVGACRSSTATRGITPPLPGPWTPRWRPDAAVAVLAPKVLDELATVLRRQSSGTSVGPCVPRPRRRGRPAASV